MLESIDCTRCGSEMAVGSGTHIAEGPSGSDVDDLAHVDLCDDCMEALKAFVAE